MIAFRYLHGAVYIFEIAVGVARSGPEDQHGGLEDHGDVMDERGATDESNGTDVRSS